MASAGLGPSFGQRDWACGPHCKVETQGPNGPGDPMSYISPPPPLICTQHPGTNQGLKDTNYPRSPVGRYWVIKRFINAPLKGEFYLAIWFSRHHCLMIYELRGRAWQLQWGFIEFLAPYLLNAIYSSFGSYIQFLLSLFFTFYILDFSNSRSIEHTFFMCSSSSLEHLFFLGPTVSSLCLSFHSLFFFQFSLVLSLRTLVQ